MKQHITKEQLNELTEEQKKKLMNCMDMIVNKKALEINPLSLVVHWHEDRNYLLSIGQMIEFLDEKRERPDIHAPSITDESLSGWWIQTMSVKTAADSKEELCNILWKAVKEVL